MQGGLRRRLVLAAVGVVALGLAAFTIAYNVVLAHRLNRDADGLLRSRASAQLANVTLNGGRPGVVETPNDIALDERAWVFSGKRAVERPPASAPVQAAVDGLAGVSRRTLREGPSDTRLLALPVLDRGRNVGTVVAAVSLVPYEHTEHIALVTSLALDALLLLLVALVARKIVTAALQPVAQMTAQAADWGEHDLDRRFALGPPRDELTALAATLDGLLGRLSASLRHEQRFSAEVAHELRTPLAALRAETELALDRGLPQDELREALETILRHADRMTAVIDTLLVAAQREADPRHGTVDAREAAVAAGETCDSLAAERGVAVSIDPGAAPIEVDADRELTTQILAPLLENAVRYGRSSVRLGIARNGGTVTFTVDDDGPGLPPDELDSVFEPGVRGSVGAGTAGAGLGLPLARRLARLAGGDVEAVGNSGGGRFVVRLPAS